MHRARNAVVASERARWLAELAETIDQAQRVAWRLANERDSGEARELYASLEAARLEVAALRCGRWVQTQAEFDPPAIAIPVEGN